MGTFDDTCKSGFYNGYTNVDTMNGDATEAFQKSTHETYAELVKTIKVIFTDEPHHGDLRIRLTLPSFLP